MARGHTTYDFDVIIVGSGAGGGVASHILNNANKKIALVEEEHIGGECPNWGCVPTKALLHTAETYVAAKEGEKFGVKASAVKIDMREVKKWKNLTVKRTGTSAGEKAFEAKGITVIHGRAHFLDNHTISIGKQRFKAKKFVIATGTSNFVPPIEGIEKAGFLTHREAGNIVKKPKSIFVIGGGAIGCEFTQYFSSIGVKTHIAEFAPRLLIREDKEVGQVLQMVFEKNGVAVHTATQVLSVKKTSAGKLVKYKKDGKVHEATVEEVLLAAGMKPNTDIGLENAGVEYSRRGIVTNDQMQTSAKNIFAVGDVTGPYAFTHMATYQARIAAHNILHRNKIVAKYHAVPRCVFTDPEIASVGMSEVEVNQKKIKYKKAAVPISIIGRSNTSDKDIGFVKVIATKQGVIIGASVVAPRAGEMMQELALAVNLGLKVDDVAATIHAFPTWSEAVRIACARLV